MDSGELAATGDVGAAAWIEPRLAGHFGAVTLAVPGGYAAYARIFHPTCGDERPTTWSQVARVTGRRTHPLMQWHALVGSSDLLNADGSIWPGAEPPRGNLVPEVLGPLCDVLAGHTATPDRCYFCLWAGWAGAMTRSCSLSGAAQRSGSRTGSICCSAGRCMERCK